MPFDVLRDFLPVSVVATQPNVLVVHPALPARSVKQLVALAKTRPGELNFASAGTGSSGHLSGELFMMVTGVRMVHVPYKGTPAAVMAVSTDEVQVFLISAATAQGYIKGGKVRAIATTGTQRSPIMPDVPTMIEAGLPNYTNYNWLGIFTTAGTPQPVIDKLNIELVKALNDPGVKESLSKQGWNLVGGSPESLRKLINEEMVRFEKVVRDGAIQIDQP